MDRFFRKTWVEISVDSLISNLTNLRRILPPSMKILAVVKADAYGHGAVEIAKYAVKHGVDYLGVAFLDEALELRSAGISAPILVMGYTPPEGIQMAWQNNVTITAYSNEVLEEIQRFIQTNKPNRPLRIHIKTDTGMGRLGLHSYDLAMNYIETISNIEGIEIEGLFTHYANADEKDKSYTHMQHSRFQAIVEACQRKGIRPPLIHAGNSATAIDMSELSYNMVRIGISMYGLYPSVHINQAKLELEPVLSLKTTVVHVKTLPKGSGISYGTRYVTQQDETIATLPIGYADGYSRILTGKAQVLIHGHLVPIVGTICMDQCMIRVEANWNVQPGDEVVLIGKQNQSVISADDLAERLGTINYEITCMLSHRAPRVYVYQGNRVHVYNPLLHRTATHD